MILSNNNNSEQYHLMQNPGTNLCSSSTASATSSFTNLNLWVGDDMFFVCMWTGCQYQKKQQRIDSVERLESHIDEHLLEYTSLLESLSQNGNLMCQIRGCQIIVTCVEELFRHMKMHIFHAARMQCGLIAVKQRCPNLECCKFPPTSRLVYQGDPLLCEWNSCLKSFTDINMFPEHIEQHVQCLSMNDRQQNLYECLWDGCQATFKNKAHLRLHVHHHSGDKMCACPFCGTFFSNVSGLIEHVQRRQDGNSSLTCYFCQKTFTSDAILKKHCKRHIRSYKCQYCSLVLIAPYDLNRHIQTVHAKIRNHICEHCGRAFYQRSDLNKHVELHLNSASHECAECGQKFRWSKQLREHTRKHSKDYNPTPYECHLCNMRYPRGSALSKHFITVHKMSVLKGFSRFQYKKCQDGFFRLQTKCYMKDVIASGECDNEELLNRME